ncbi:hypothetical protein glysoja_026675 [Glycine soja]|uniref:Uncharacterized protein n=1 Tax=Glycine soja TaxID=3848 RepID=A0A0B2PPB5_GLYSO|nr:hypothetical protein glysoja_026675 [Glycine soja]
MAGARGCRSRGTYCVIWITPFFRGSVGPSRRSSSRGSPLIIATVEICILSGRSNRRKRSLKKA